MVTRTNVGLQNSINILKICIYTRKEGWAVCIVGIVKVKEVNVNVY